jgi:hypothetical protein
MQYVKLIQSVTMDTVHRLRHAHSFNSYVGILIVKVTHTFKLGAMRVSDIFHHGLWSFFLLDTRPTQVLHAVQYLRTRH